MVKTKKFTVSVSFGDFSTKKAEFVVPFGDEEGCAFLGIKSGTKFPYAALSFIGKEIDTQEVLNTMASNGIVIQDNFASSLEMFFDQMKCFKIGNVLSIVDKDGEPTLEKIANRPPRPKPKLP